MTYYYAIDKMYDKPEFWDRLDKLSGGMYIKQKIVRTIFPVYAKMVLDELPPFFGKCVYVAVKDGRHFLELCVEASKAIGLDRIIFIPLSKEEE